MDGILLIDKPIGWTSHDVVNKLRRLLHTQKIGHTGTLDPLATGLLVVCIGKATKFVKYLTDHDKEYIAEIALGIKTNTDDITGKITESRIIESIDTDEVIKVLNRFKGTINQIPPVASAIKIDGKRAYKYIHNDQEEPVMAPREVTIDSIDLLNLPIISEGKAFFTLNISCSKGTYIRSLARDIGDALNIPATLSNLRRTRVGSFRINQSCQIEEINPESVHLLDPVDYLGFSRVNIADEYLFKVSNGAFLPTNLFTNLQDTIVCNKEGIPLAIYSYDEDRNIMRLSVLI